MTYVDNADVGLFTFNVIRYVIEPIAGTLSTEQYKELGDKIKSILANSTGLDMKDSDTVYMVERVQQGVE